MIAPQSAAHCDKNKRQARARRHKLLALMDREFTVPELATVATLSKPVAASMVLAMPNNGEVEDTETVRSVKTKVYRKTPPF